MVLVIAVSYKSAWVAFVSVRGTRYSVLGMRYEEQVLKTCVMQVVVTVVR
jgi:hypothetical protein